MVEVYSINIDSQIAIEEYEYYITFLSKEKRERLQRYYFQEDKRRSLYGEIMIRSLINERLGIDNANIIFSCNTFGKPYLIGYPNFHFNISHSGEWVICGIGCNKLGVDIEKIIEKKDLITKSIFTNNEYYDLIKTCEKDRFAYFYDLWTLKESYTKCIGKGLSIPLNSFSFEILKDNNILSPPNNLYSFKKYSCISGYRISVCSFEEVIDDHIQNFNIY
ncbi:4'-phosphopantetheinyl transferase superfamily protein [Clostridium estertheticum]|uniref:4'-phosphopantetheinyl transferase superfamily protein n=1 Tax=Clostridium estertheticum TaxID=238834 RepID=A0A5N7IUT5_9CLOT|nr:4'-phosphopantetheinyl transferase superfamily protein [Clostridium estertheticum]MPQ34060.1 4'-phosphopantetheinyl transferase superfamily protein [Clostridium estertheticum]MPQ64861.1 4'-phosphopantetheinyl transferase superfamily protein [Clostridium estertheticum]